MLGRCSCQLVFDYGFASTHVNSHKVRDFVGSRNEPVKGLNGSWFLSKTEGACILVNRVTGARPAIRRSLF